VPKPKPELRRYPLAGKTVPNEAFKGEREVYDKGKWKRAKLYEMDLLQPGNEVEGLAIIEAPATTLPDAFLERGGKVTAHGGIIDATGVLSQLAL